MKLFQIVTIAMAALCAGVAIVILVEHYKYDKSFDEIFGPRVINTLGQNYDFPGGAVVRPLTIIDNDMAAKGHSACLDCHIR